MQCVRLQQAENGDVVATEIAELTIEVRGFQLTKRVWLDNGRFGPRGSPGEASSQRRWPRHKDRCKMMPTNCWSEI
jgi:hypothetical protein